MKTKRSAFHAGQLDYFDLVICQLRLGKLSFRTHSAVLRAGFDAESRHQRFWIPAFAGMTSYKFNYDRLPVSCTSITVILKN
jgi:hypothetical protein